MEYITNSTELTAVADAIRSKGGTSDSLSFPAGFVSAIENIPTGGSPSVKNLVFIDYDGSEVSSYTTQEALALTALPANPSHTGLTAQGWNWSLANIKSYLTDYPNAIVYVGQMYITSDGKTRIYVTFNDPAALSPYLAVAVNGTISVDWGDNSTPDTITGESDITIVFCQHTYGSTGSYIITITVSSGYFEFRGESSYASCLTVSSSSNNDRRAKIYSNAITKVNIGSNARVGIHSFRYCSSLKSITIPDSVTNIGSYSFVECFSLESMTIPDGVTDINGYMLQKCYSIKSISISDSVTSIWDYAFEYCYALKSIAIPEGVTTIGDYVLGYCTSLKSVFTPDSVTSLGVTVFSGCTSLESVTLGRTSSIKNGLFGQCRSLKSLTIPSSVTSIGSSALSDCCSLKSITIPSGVTSIDGYAFSGCSALESVTIEDGVASIGGSAFSSCFSLKSVDIPDSVTSIGYSAFSECHSLASFTVPDSVTNISGRVFGFCYGMKECHIKPTTPPTLGTAAFTGVPSNAIIYVPYSADHSILENYQTASGWSTYASQIQEEPAP